MQEREAIEAEFGDRLVWERLDELKQSRIKYQSDDFNVFNEDDWERMIDFLVDGMVRMERAFKKPLSDIRGHLKSR